MGLRFWCPVEISVTSEAELDQCNHMREVFWDKSSTPSPEQGLASLVQYLDETYQV